MNSYETAEDLPHKTVAVWGMPIRRNMARGWPYRIALRTPYDLLRGSCWSRLVS